MARRRRTFAVLEHLSPQYALFAPLESSDTLNTVPQTGQTFVHVAVETLSLRRIRRAFATLEHASPQYSLFASLPPTDTVNIVSQTAQTLT